MYVYLTLTGVCLQCEVLAGCWSRHFQHYPNIGKRVCLFILGPPIAVHSDIMADTHFVSSNSPSRAVYLL